MKKKEGKNIFHKKWAEINNNDSVDNDERVFSPKMHKIEEIGKTPLFSIGDIWTEEAEDKSYFYKVAAIEQRHKGHPFKGHLSSEKSYPQGEKKNFSRQYL